MHLTKDISTLFILMLPVLALADVKTSNCDKQFNQLLLTTVNCSLDVRPDSLKQIVALSGGAFKDVACVIPLKFAKSDVYQHWIKENSVSLPKFIVNCHLVVANAEKLTVATYIQPLCSRKQNREWSCSINMSGTEGLGVLGTILESQVNESKLLKSEMEKFLKSH